MMALYDTKNYEVQLAANDEVMAEDGKYDADRKGYVVINKETGVIEHTTMILPQAIYQAQGFSDSLDALLKADDAAEVVDIGLVPVADDILPN
jgi:hypothetical protein